MGSTRLPGKVMKEILGRPMISYAFEQAKKAKTIGQVWLATTKNSEDDVLAKWAEAQKIPYYRGSVNDVLDRYYQTALKAKLKPDDIIVRLTGDCPLLDPEVIDKTVGSYNNCDYLSTGRLTSTFPDGLDTEVFSLKVLKKAWLEAKLPSDREHVASYIWNHPDIFKVETLNNSRNLSSYRFTVDNPEDFQLVSKLIEFCHDEQISINMENIIKILQNHPQWLLINAKLKRNEGYFKSIQDEK